MKLITLQGEIEADNVGYLVTEQIDKPIKVLEVQLPAEMTMQQGYTEIKAKLLKYKPVTIENLRDAEDVTDEFLGTEKVYLENQVMQLKTNYEIPFYGYNLIFRIKNGTGSGRMYTVQVWYE